VSGELGEGDLSLPRGGEVVMIAGVGSVGDEAASGVRSGLMRIPPFGVESLGENAGLGGLRRDVEASAVVKEVDKDMDGGCGAEV
jgi:hypothetical protein